MKEKLTVFFAICFSDNLFGQEDSSARSTTSAVSSRVESQHQLGGAGLDKDVEAFDFPYVEALAAAAAVAAVATVLVVAGVTATR